MHPYIHALSTPDKPAVIMAGSGTVLTYRQLDERSNRIAHLFRECGLRQGDCVAILMENNSRLFEIIWAAQRSGLFFVCISYRLKPSDIAYIIGNSGAKAIVSSHTLHELAVKATDAWPELPRFVVDSDAPGFRRLEEEMARHPASPIPDQLSGMFLLYSSGTTGRPKGVRRLVKPAPIDAPDTQVAWCRDIFGVDQDSIYLSPAPLYHAAPLGWCMAVQRLGGAVIVMEHFDAERALALIERYHVTHAQWVPTHFVRMLKLPDEVRVRYDVSSLKVAVHAAAPCPIWAKQEMMQWWGPILHEYYGGSEGNGITAVGPLEWLARPGTVGQAVLGEIKICDDEGHVLPAGTEGDVFFAGGAAFEYIGNTEATAQSRNAQGWTTLGDIGWLDADGYLYLTDRKNFLIISGGVNIYPQEIEDALLEHPDIADIAVVGAPDPDLGETIAAVVQPMAGVAGDAKLRDDIGRFAAATLPRSKRPARIDFLEELPRHPNGKLYKRLIKDAYRQAHSAQGKGLSQILSDIILEDS